MPNSRPTDGLLPGVMLVVRRSVTLTSSGPKTPSPKNSQGDRPNAGEPGARVHVPCARVRAATPGGPWDQFNGLAANLEKARPPRPPWKSGWKAC